MEHTSNIEEAIKLLNEYSQALNGDICMPTTGIEMMSKSMNVKIVADNLKSHLTLHQCDERKR